MINVKDLQRKGAQLRLTELDVERRELLSMFPELRTSAVRDGEQTLATPLAAHRPAKASLRTEAQRRKQSAAMKRYWAKKRRAG